MEANGQGYVELQPLTLDEQADEMLLMGLRLREGLDLDRLAAVSGIRPSSHAIADLTRLGLLGSDRDGDRIRATAAGRLVLNEVIARLAAGLGP